MATATMTQKAFRDVQKHAEEIKNDGEHTVANRSPGDMWAQGDIGILCLAELPNDAEFDPKPQSQLSPGNTQGSRHCIVDLPAVKIYRLKSATVLDGPIVDAPCGFKVDHPEHGAITMPPGVYGIVYQRSFAEELRRVQD